MSRENDGTVQRRSWTLIAMIVVACFVGWIANKQLTAFVYDPESPCKHMKDPVLLVGDSTMRELFESLCREVVAATRVECNSHDCREASCIGNALSVMRVDKAAGLRVLQNITTGRMIVSIGMHDILYTRNISAFQADMELLAGRAPKGLMWLPPRYVQNKKVVQWKRQFLTNDAIAFYNAAAESIMRAHGVPVLSALKVSDTIDGIHVTAAVARQLARALCSQLVPKSPNAIDEVSVMLWGARYTLVMFVGVSVGVIVRGGGESGQLSLHHSWLKMCVVLLYVYFATTWPFAAKTASADFFCGCFVMLLIVAIAVHLLSSSPQADESEKDVLNRNQTEEQKGWMQAMFLLYHLFAVSSVYIFVRVLVSGFIWLTGFGHAAFQKSGVRFSWTRFWIVLFRLNFFCVLLMIVTGNNYMLYYVCALHMWWFVLVTGPWEIGKLLGAAEELVVALFCVVSVLWDIPNVIETLFLPFKWVLGVGGSLHEFYFRTHLDHFIGGWGLLVGLRLMQVREVISLMPSIAVGGCGLLCLFVWCVIVWHCDSKFSYNAIHPYISAIPVHGLWLLRNCHPFLRSRSLRVLVWVGRRSLEFYLLQFHILMSANARGQLAMLPYPLVNILLTGLAFVLCAAVAFDSTKIIQENFSCDTTKSVAVGMFVGVLLSTSTPHVHWFFIFQGCFLVGFLLGFLRTEALQLAHRMNSLRNT